MLTCLWYQFIYFSFSYIKSNLYYSQPYNVQTTNKLIFSIVNYIWMWYNKRAWDFLLRIWKVFLFTFLQTSLGVFFLDWQAKQQVCSLILFDLILRRECYHLHKCMCIPYTQLNIYLYMLIASFPFAGLWNVSCVNTIHYCREMCTHRQSYLY